MIASNGSGVTAADFVPNPVVHTDAGMVRGDITDKALTFKGIPFAQPPVGPLRWREPQPSAAWPDIRDARQASKPCTQDRAGLDPFLSNLAAHYGQVFRNNEPLVTSEDCLYLNVWVPRLSPQGMYPVMVWLHGGSNLKGSGAQSMYDGTALAAKGVVVVTINYRLGVFGFFTHPALVTDSPHHSAGNYGLLDQIAALKWVQNNIRAFQGDPDNVTLFGESAGAVDASLLMTSPIARGYFKRVIAESGPPYGFSPVVTLSDTIPLGTAIAAAAPGDPATPLANLRALAPDALVDLVNRTTAQDGRGARVTGVIVDGWVIPEDPRGAFANHADQMVDLLLGLNGRELSAYRPARTSGTGTPHAVEHQDVRADILELADRTRVLYGNRTTAAVTMYRFESLFRPEQALDHARNDMAIACPLGSIASLLTAGGHRAYVYRFDRTIPGQGEASLGSFHSLELPFVFDAFNDPNWQWLHFTEDDHKLSETIERYWINFATRGDPNSESLPAWQPWSSSDEAYIDFENPAKAVSRSSFSPPFCRLAPDRLKASFHAN